MLFLLSIKDVLNTICAPSSALYYIAILCLKYFRKAFVTFLIQPTLNFYTHLMAYYILRYNISFNGLGISHYEVVQNIMPN